MSTVAEAIMAGLTWLLEKPRKWQKVSARQCSRGGTSVRLRACLPNDGFPLLYARMYLSGSKRKYPLACSLHTQKASERAGGSLVLKSCTAHVGDNFDNVFLVAKSATSFMGENGGAANSFFPYLGRGTASARVSVVPSKTHPMPVRRLQLSADCGGALVSSFNCHASTWLYMLSCPLILLEVAMIFVVDWINAILRRMF